MREMREMRAVERKDTALFLWRFITSTAWNTFLRRNETAIWPGPTTGLDAPANGIGIVVEQPGVFAAFEPTIRVFGTEKTAEWRLVRSNERFHHYTAFKMALFTMALKSGTL